MKKVFLLVLGLWSSAALAQAPGGNNDLLMSLYNQLEALQQEVQSLRGIVEEQTYQIRRIENEQRDRYLDIDRRLNSGATGAPASVAPGATAPNGGIPPAASSQTAGVAGQPAGAVPGSVAPPVSSTPQPPTIAGNQPLTTATPGATATTAPPVTQMPGSVAPSMPAAPPLNEQDLYRTALNLLLEQSQYEESIRMFQSYIDSYPQGRLLTNAYYWQGEALILVSRFAEAQAVFSKIINDFPQDPKAADAMLKLGVVYQRLGNDDQARQTWREIATRYPENVTVIRAAQDYLNRR